MPRRTFERTVLALLLLGSYAVAFGDCSLIGHAQAQTGSSSGGTTSGAAPSGPAPTTPTQSPVTNPSSPGTVTQPSYTPSTRSGTTPSPSSNTPSTSSATAPAPSTAPNGEAISVGNEVSTNARSERRRSVARSRFVHHRHRGHPALVTYGCSHLGCVRTYAWAFPCQYYSRYCAPLYDYAAPGPVVIRSAPWWPGYYDYAPGQFGRPASLGRGHHVAYVAN
jgi:hypothetical protein